MTVDDYIASKPEAVREKLTHVRNAIRRAIPEAAEIVAYNMPTYMLKGKRALCFAAWKRHYSLYAATRQVAAAFAEELTRYRIEKGTIRFPLDEPVPIKLIERIARFRAMPDQPLAEPSQSLD